MNTINTLKLIKVFSILLLGLNLSTFISCKSESKKIMPVVKPKIPAKGTETAVFAGGCFWGVEGVFEQLTGVLDVVSGYSGGNADTAHYNIVSSGNTGHAESVKIIFDPKTISYETLLKVFFLVAHNPTELNYQGPDIGTQYRSAVFYLNEKQKELTENYIKKLTDNGIFKSKIVTVITALTTFYPAEDYHQDFLRLNPDYPYIVYWDLPKIELLKKEFPELISKK